MVCFCHKCTCRWGSAQSFLIGIVVKFLSRPVAAALAPMRARWVAPVLAADMVAVAATVVHPIVAAVRPAWHCGGGGSIQKE